MTAPPAPAVRILMGTYWSSGGWRPHPSTAPTDFAEAVAAGVMFDAPAALDHDQLVMDIRRLANDTSLEDASAAFVSSLSSRRLDLRSALGSYVIARRLPEHSFTAHPGSHLCAICGTTAGDGEIDRNVLNFERFKWGGVRRDDLAYIWHDLKTFAATEGPGMTIEDQRTFQVLLEELEQLQGDVTASKAASTSMRTIKANKDERSVLLDILGVCSVLRTPGHPGYKDTFVAYVDRELPARRFVDDAYPACWWRAEHGIDRQAARDLGLFG